MVDLTGTAKKEFYVRLMPMARMPGSLPPKFGYQLINPRPGNPADRRARNQWKMLRRRIDNLPNLTQAAIADDQL